MQDHTLFEGSILPDTANLWWSIMPDDPIVTMIGVITWTGLHTALITAEMSSYLGIQGWNEMSQQFVDTIFKLILLKENVGIWVSISMKSIPKGPIDNKSKLGFGITGGLFILEEACFTKFSCFFFRETNIMKSHVCQLYFWVTCTWSQQTSGHEYINKQRLYILSATSWQFIMLTECQNRSQNHYTISIYIYVYIYIFIQITPLHLWWTHGRFITPLTSTRSHAIFTYLKRGKKICYWNSWAMRNTSLVGGKHKIK